MFILLEQYNASGVHIASWQWGLIQGGFFKNFGTHCLIFNFILVNIKLEMVGFFVYELGILSDMIFYTTFSIRSWARPIREELFGTRCVFSAIFNFILMNIKLEIVGFLCMS